MEGTVAYYLTYLYKSFFMYSQQELKKLNINYGELPFIIFIGKFKNTTQGKLKEALNVDWGHSQRVIEKLIKEGFVLKTKDLIDRRVYHLNLTVKGEEAYSLSHNLFCLWDEKNLDSLSKEEKGQLLNILKKLVKNNKENGKI